jgi:hypothetical protein
MQIAISDRAAAPGRHQPQADGLRQATDSPQGLSVSGLRPKQGPTLSEGRLPYPASGETTS